MIRWLLRKWPIMIRDNRGREVPLVAPITFTRDQYAGWFNPRYTGNHAGHAVAYQVQIETSGIYGGVAGLCIIPGRLLFSTVFASWTFWGADVAKACILGLCAWPLFPIVARLHRKKRAALLRKGFFGSRMLRVV